MKVKVRVQRQTTEEAIVWIDCNENMTHHEAIEAAAQFASDNSLWEIKKFEISHGVGSGILEREK